MTAFAGGHVIMLTLMLLNIQRAELSGRSGVETAILEEAGEHASDT